MRMDVAYLGADEWTVQDSPRNAVVWQRVVGSGWELYCWECSGTTCEHTNAVYQWMKTNRWLEENDENRDRAN